MGRQVHFDVGGEDFYADLLLFHVEQLRYFVIELKTGKFKPERTGQLQFYVALVENRLRRASHAPTVGILVCGSRNDRVVRYALNQADAPLAVSTFSYASLPAAEQEALPSEDDLAAALDQITEGDEGTS